MALKYTGGEYGGSLPNIPSRDLTDAEAARLGGEAFLIATGLYEKAASQPAKPQPKPQGKIDLSDGVDTDEARLAGQALAARKEKQP